MADLLPFPLARSRDHLAAWEIRDRATGALVTAGTVTVRIASGWESAAALSGLEVSASYNGTRERWEATFPAATLDANLPANGAPVGEVVTLGGKPQARRRCEVVAVADPE